MTEKRDFVLDNVKGLLIILVIFGHLIEPFIFRGNSYLDDIYTAIYIFHMPAFIFVSGYFSKKHNVKKILEIFIVYSFWQLIVYPFVISFIRDKSFLDIIRGIGAPFKTYWYLVSLLAWRILTPYIAKIKYIFPITLIVGVVFGLIDSPVNLAHFSVGRTITFYPFFILGYCFKREYVYSIRQFINRRVGLILFSLVIAVGVCFLNADLKDLVSPKAVNKILYGKNFYDEIYKNPVVGVMYKTVLYCVQLLSVLFLLSWVSSTKNILCKIGGNTMFTYLSHALAIEIFYYFNKYSQSEIRSTIYIIGINLVIAFIFSYILSLEPIQKITNKFVSFNVDRILKKD